MVVYKVEESNVLMLEFISGIGVLINCWLLFNVKFPIQEQVYTDVTIVPVLDTRVQPKFIVGSVLPDL